MISEKDVVALAARIQPLMDSIDLDADLSDEVLSSIAFAELSGTSMSDEGKKSLELEERGLITGDQYQSLCFYRIAGAEVYRQNVSQEGND